MVIAVFTAAGDCVRQLGKKKRLRNFRNLDHLLVPGFRMLWNIGAVKTPECPGRCCSFQLSAIYGTYV